jgi:large subunit ribosomal protein L13
VVVTNAHKIHLSGRKAETMVYPRYSYYPGGYREIPLRRVMERHPERVLRESVRRMLPKNALAKHMLKKLKLYCVDGHPHAAQQPKPLTL